VTIDYLKEKKELVSVVLLGVSVVMAVSILLKVTGFFTASAKAENIVKTAIALNTEGAHDIDKYFAKYKKLADALKKNNLFAPPPPKQHPVSEITGILGNEVIISDKLYKVGDKVGDAKIVAIEATQVTIEWEGKTKTFSPMDAGGTSGPGKTGGSRRSGPARSSGGTAQMVTVRSEGIRVTEEKLKNKSEAKMQAKRAKQDEEILKNVQERWSTLSEQEQQKLMKIRERWPSMSDGERDKIRAGLNKRFSGGKQGGK